MGDIDSLEPSIGTRVFVVIPPKGVVVPAIVIEKLTRETPQGISSQYLLNFGEPGKTRVPSDAIPGSIVVGSSQDAYDAIVDYAMKKAKQAVQSAQQVAEQRFGPVSSPRPTQEDSREPMNVDELMKIAVQGTMSLDDTEAPVTPEGQHEATPKGS